MPIVPTSVPQIKLPELLKRVGKLRPDGFPVFLVGVRGYYLDTMGAPGKNDRGIYDDAIVLVSPSAYMTVNANCDPSVFRPGIASLVPGLHWYKKGYHGISHPGGGYPAFRPASSDESVPVTRDGQPGVSKGIAINIHRGSLKSTSSLGCQTVYPPQWAAFQSTVYAELDRNAQKRLPYILL